LTRYLYTLGYIEKRGEPSAREGSWSDRVR
jgi:hypothetical protein